MSEPTTVRLTNELRARLKRIMPLVAREPALDAEMSQSGAIRASLEAGVRWFECRYGIQGQVDLQRIRIVVERFLGLCKWNVFAEPAGESGCPAEFAGLLYGGELDWVVLDAVADRRTRHAVPLGVVVGTSRPASLDPTLVLNLIDGPAIESESLGAPSGAYLGVANTFCITACQACGRIQLRARREAANGKAGWCLGCRKAQQWPGAVDAGDIGRRWRAALIGRRPTRPSRRNWERELVDRCGFAGVGESIDGWHPYRLADETVDGLAWCRTGPSLAATGELAVLCADIVQPDRMVRKGHLAGYMQWTGSALTGLVMGLKTRHEGVRDR